MMISNIPSTSGIQKIGIVLDEKIQNSPVKSKIVDSKDNKKIPPNKATKKEELCKFFNKGNCNKKNECLFVHQKKICKEICKFFKNGKSNKKEDCRFSHPKLCRKFKQFGGKNNNEKGCDEKCDFFHL